MGKRAVAVLCSITTAAAVLAAPSPASARLAVNASIDEISVLDDGYYGYIRALFSADLSTAAYMRYDTERDESVGLFVVDLATDTQRQVTTPRSIANVEALGGLDGDGSTALVYADWEGIEAGDADGGLLDAFLVDTATGDVELLTGSLGEVSVLPVGLDDDGDTAALTVYTSDTEASLYLWDEGALTELALPGDVNSGLRIGGDTLLSPDGTALLYSSQLGFQTRWHLYDIASGDETVVAAPPASRPTMSSDGSIVAAASWNGQDTSRVYIWDTSGATLRSALIDGAAQQTHMDRAGTELITSGQSYTYDEAAGSENFSITLVGLDLDSGAQTTYAESNVPGELSVVAIDEGAERMVIGASSSMLRTGPATLDEIYGGYGGESGLYLIDFDGEAQPIRVAGYVGSLDDQMARLYEAYFDRAPDAGGLEFWRNQRAGGRSLDSVSDEFARSPEFVDTYGDLGDDAFVDLVYENVLDRAPDAGGRAFWLDQLANGRTRGSLMTLFSESPEFIDATGTLPAESPTEAAIRRLYGAMFGREADTAGLSSWMSEVDRGVPLDDVAWYFIQTDEFRQLYAGLEGDPFAMMMMLYANGTTTQPAESAYDIANSFYDQGRPIEEIIVDITNSAPFVAATSSTPIGR